MDIEWSAIADLIGALAVPVITVFGVWVRSLIDEIKYLKSAVASLKTDNDREHGAVMTAVSDLSKELTTEVRGIVLQHSEHDKEMVRISCKLDRLMEEK